MATASHSHFTYTPIPAPASASPEHFKDFGRQVEGYVPSEVTPEQTQEIIDMLYKVGPARCAAVRHGHTAVHNCGA
jgi:GH24 family phage-related lysozyme (muramidase)